MVALIDTTGIWGLYFSNSVYHKFMSELRERVEILIRKILFIEVVYPIYEAQGMHEMKKLANFFEILSKTENIMINTELASISISECSV